MPHRPACRPAAGHPDITAQLRALRRRIGGNLRAARERRAMPLRKLGRLSGLPPATIDAWELGKGEVDLHGLLRLASALRVEMGSLLTQ